MNSLDSTHLMLNEHSDNRRNPFNRPLLLLSLLNRSTHLTKYNLLLTSETIVPYRRLPWRLLNEEKTCGTPRVTVTFKNGFDVSCCDHHAMILIQYKTSLHCRAVNFSLDPAIFN